MKYVAVGTRKTIRQRNKKVAEAETLTMVTLLTLVIVVIQGFSLVYMTPGLTLQEELVHVASDLLINGTATWVAYEQIAMVDEKAIFALEKKFMYFGIGLILTGTTLTAGEAIKEIFNGSAPTLDGDWLIVVGLIDGIGNYIAHRLLDKIPHHDRSHKHQAVHMHTIEDIFLAIVVICSGVLSKYFNWHGADPYLSFIVIGWVYWRSYQLYRKVKAGERPSCC